MGDTVRDVIWAGVLRARAAPANLVNTVIPAGSAALIGDTPLVVGVYDVRSYGATGNGITDDTAAFQAASVAVQQAGGGTLLIPAGRYLLHATTYLASDTVVMGAGRGATTLLAATDWPELPAGRYAFFENLNYDAGTIIDRNITIRDLTLDYGDFGPVNPPGGGQHAIRMWFAGGVLVEDVEFQLNTAEDATAFRAVQDGLITGCFAYNARNCTYDHWEECQRCAVVSCHAESPLIAQMVNWNVERTGGPNVGRSAKGFVLANNVFRYTGAVSAPIFLSPIVGGNYASDITVSGNVLHNCHIIMRGGVTGSVIAGNVFSAVAGGFSAIAVHAYNGDAPAAISVSGNTVVDPATSAGNLGVIRVECDSATVMGNTVSGTSYGVVPGVYCGSSTVVLGVNYVSNGVVTATAGTISSANTRVGNNKQLGFFDTSGSVAHMIVQTDNNLLFNGTSSSGAIRTFMSIFQRSSSSELTLPLPTLLGGGVRYVPVTGIAAVGTNIGTATNLTGNINVVATCTAGANDGVALNATNGREQTVINTTADILKVYPNNGGAAQIDAGGVGVATTIAAGKSKTFVQVVLNDFRTVAVT